MAETKAELQARLDAAEMQMRKMRAEAAAETEARNEVARQRELNERSRPYLNAGNAMANPVPVHGDGRDDGRSANVVAIVALLAVLMFLVVAILGASAVAYKVFFADTLADGQADVRPDRGTSDYARDIENIGMTPEHALYFAKVFDGSANRMEADGKSKDPIVDQRSEVLDHLAAVGQLSTIGNDAANYRRLPDVIEEAFSGVFEEDDDGKLLGGRLTDDDRDEVVERYRELAEGFRGAN